MKSIVIYKSKYGSTKAYAEWIAEELGCELLDAKKAKTDKLAEYDTIIYGGGLYAEIINGVTLITKNLDKLDGKKIIVYTTGLIPLDCRDYYDKLLIERNFTPEMLDKIKIFNFLGKMIIEELSIPHKAAIKMLKKVMQGKENPTETEKLLIDLFDKSGDFTDREAIKDLIEYANN